MSADWDDFVGVLQAEFGGEFFAVDVTDFVFGNVDDVDVRLEAHEMKVAQSEFFIVAEIEIGGELALFERFTDASEEVGVSLFIFVTGFGFGRGFLETFFESLEVA